MRMAKKKITKKLFLLSETFPPRITVTESRNDMIQAMQGLCFIFGYNPYQAEQCTAITFIKGKYLLKEGDEKYLTSLSESMNHFGLKSAVL